jgi:ankyrin repeat protein
MREGKSKKDALLDAQRILPSLPQHLREPLRDTRGDIWAPGAVEYISGLEVEHGSEVLGVLYDHISLEVVTYLMQSGADINAAGGMFNHTILHRAAREGHLDVLQYFISLGARVNVGDRNGWTPLHFAALYGHLSIVQFLVQSGADTNIKDKDGDTALDWARHNNKPEVVEWLQNHMT